MWLVGACGTTIELAPTPETAVYRAISADSLAPLATRLSEAFTSQADYVTLEVAAMNTAQVEAQFVTGEAELAFTLSDETDRQQATIVPIARDGIALIVHPDNPVTNLTLLDLTQLYNGQFYNWRDVQGSTGSDSVVQVVTREAGSGISALFEARLLPGQRMTPNARVFPNSRAIVDFVAHTPQAIGYIGVNHLTPKVKLVAVEEVLPLSETLSNAAYPLTYPLYLHIPPDAPSKIEEFSQFILGAAGQSIVEGMGLGRIN